MPSYVPPQPQRAGLSREVLIAAAIIGALLLILIAVFILSSPKDSPATPRPTNISAASGSTTSPRPSFTGSPTTSSLPSASPTSLPSSTPNGTPSAGYDQFLLHVPEAIRPTCVVDVVDPPNPLILFSTNCTTTDEITVVYTQYDSTDDMNAAYQDVFARVQIDPDSGSCEDEATWPAESSYDVEDVPAGRRLCTNDPRPTILWSDDRLTILSQATGPDAVKLNEFWKTEAGPLP